MLEIVLGDLIERHFIWLWSFPQIDGCGVANAG